MPELAASPTANLLAATALYEAGKSTREVAAALGIDKTTAWRLRHKTPLDPDLVKSCSKRVSDTLILTATMAAETALDRGFNGFEGVATKDLVIMAGKALESAGNYAAATGQNSGLGDLLSAFGIERSHSVSRVTMTQSVSIEQATPQPVVITQIEKT